VATANPADGEILRGALMRIDPSRVLQAVDGLQLKGHARVTPVVGFPLRTLQQKRDVATFAVGAPLAAVAALVELLAAPTLEKVVEALGDHAEAPTFEQLATALDGLVAQGASDDEEIVAVLAYAIGEGFPAAGHCRRLLAERDAWALPRVEAAPPPTLLAPRETDEAVRARRRARRAERKKAPAGAPRPAHRSRGPKSPDAPGRVDTAPAAVPSLAVTRRRLTLTPAEEARFDAEHVLAGTVVLADLPFDALDPAQPEQRSKERPCLVIAAGADGVLVRGIFSSPATTRALFEPWRRVGLDHPSYLDVARVAISVVDPASLVRLGRLNDAEWNATL
jgi:hypothetical protein